MKGRGVRCALAAGALLLTSTLKTIGDDLPAHILSLARIQRAMAEELKGLPNYTCLQTIDRYKGRSRSKLKPWDHVRVNVAMVNGRELYALPGSRSFDDRSLSTLVPKGFISDGNFGTMTRSVFVNHAARITFAGEESPDGRALLRFDFEISQMVSGWRLHVGNASATLGVTGTFWADSRAFEVVRLRYAAEDLPPWSPDKSLEEDASYGRVTIGNAAVLMPVTVDTRAETFDGESHWNRTTFSQCRQYASESVIRFDEEPGRE
jgi:hypothetical protein